MLEKLKKTFTPLGELLCRLSSGRPAAFFNGRLYPVLVVTLALIGHITGLEVFTAAVILLSASVAFLLLPTSKPFIVVASSFIFQVSLEHAPGVPTMSDYYFTSWRLVAVIAVLALFIISLLVFFVRQRLWQRVDTKKTPIYVLAALFVAFALNGAFSPEWTPDTLVFGVIMGITYTLTFLLFFLGMKGENREELIDYFAFVSACVSVLLMAEVGWLFLTGDGVIVDGEIAKESMLFGWGVWNSMGAALVMLIPTLFVGVYRSKRWYIYLALATLDLLCVFLTQSRGALLFGALVYVLAIIILALFGNKKNVFRITLGVIFASGVAVTVLLWDRIPSLVDAFLYDNGRFALWQVGLESFLSSPIFGTGFLGFKFPDDPIYFEGVGFMPAMAHNTIVELLSATGVVGALAYAVYRVFTVRAAIRTCSVEGWLIFLSALSVALMSLLDNFLFQFWPMLYYSVAMAVVYLLGKDSEERHEISVIETDTISATGESTVIDN